MNIPKVKPFPPDSAQCNHCGGNGCEICNDKGWVSAGSFYARHCLKCKCIIPPDHVAVYCSNECAFEDA